MRFHETHGAGINLLKDRTEAVHKKRYNRTDFKVFSSEPLIPGQCVDIKVRAANYSVSLCGAGLVISIYELIRISSIA